MGKYRDHLPQLSGKLFLTDGGLETTLMFHDGFELPYFAAFTLLSREDGRNALRNYFRAYLSLAKEYGAGFIIESPTWRASAAWGNAMNYSAAELAVINRQAVDLVQGLCHEYENDIEHIVVSGCIGPRSDGYNPTILMTVDQAAAYHAVQINTLQKADADMITGHTMSYVEEAIGVVRAADAADLSVVISFTVETDGRLPSGQTLQAAIQQVDEATGAAPAYYMINCAHPTHFAAMLEAHEPWTARILGVRANASAKSHAELDEADAIDDGDPKEFGAKYHTLMQAMSHLNVVGGCCGTDRRHLAEVCKALG